MKISLEMLNIFELAEKESAYLKIDNRDYAI